MGNLSEPTEILAGDTVAWSRTFADYSSADGWTLNYIFRSPTAKLEIAATAGTGDAFDISISATETAALTPGEYSWAAYASKADERYTVAAGSLIVLQNLAGEGDVDPRSANQRTLDAITAVLEGRASSDVQEYTIGSRSMKKMTIAELLKLQQTYAYRVARERGTAPSFMGAGFMG